MNFQRNFLIELHHALKYHPAVEQFFCLFCYINESIMAELFSAYSC
jgi:hypothetical protein